MLIPSILITTNTLAAGGAEKQRITLANELAERGHPTTLYCIQALGPLQPLVSPRVRLVLAGGRFPLPPRACVYIVGTTNTEVAFAAISRATKRMSIWLSVIHNPVGDGAPTLPPLVRVGLKQADSAAALSPWHADELSRRMGISTDVILPNGIDTTGLQFVRNTRLQTSKFEFDLGFFGRISIKHKGLDTLLQCLRDPRLKRCTLAIAGEGPDRARLSHMVSEMGLQRRVSLVGHLAPEDFFPRIATLAMFSRFEAQPLVLMESAAANLPVVATESSGASSNERVFVSSRHPDLEELIRLLRLRLETPYEGESQNPPSAKEMTEAYVGHIEYLINRPRTRPFLPRRNKSKAAAR